MDMKRILQAMDGVATKPVEGANDMKKFLQVVTEGANPHKVSLPVQMAMQHYQKPAEPKVTKKPSIIGQYFQEAEAELIQQKDDRRRLLNQYANIIAERVMMRESKELNELSTEKLAQYKTAAGKDAKAADKSGDYDRGNKRFSGIVKATKKQFANDAKKVDEVSKQTLSKYIPANAEDQVQRASSASFKSGAAGDKYNKSDDTHKEKMRKQGMERAVKKLAKVDENEIPDHSMGFKPGPGSPGIMSNENNKNTPPKPRNFVAKNAKATTSGAGAHKDKKKEAKQGYEKHKSKFDAMMEDPCWDKYKQVGMKKKGKRMVPNCVPKK